MVLRIESRASCILDKHLLTELHSSPGVRLRPAGLRDRPCLRVGGKGFLSLVAFREEYLRGTHCVCFSCVAFYPICFLFCFVFRFLLFALFLSLSQLGPTTIKGRSSKTQQTGV